MQAIGHTLPQYTQYTHTAKERTIHTLLRTHNIHTDTVDTIYTVLQYTLYTHTTTVDTICTHCYSTHNTYTATVHTIHTLLQYTQYIHCYSTHNTYTATVQTLYVRTLLQYTKCIPCCTVHTIHTLHQYTQHDWINIFTRISFNWMGVFFSFLAPVYTFIHTYVHTYLHTRDICKIMTNFIDFHAGDSVLCSPCSYYPIGYFWNHLIITIFMALPFPSADNCLHSCLHKPVWLHNSPFGSRWPSSFSPWGKTFQWISVDS